MPSYIALLIRKRIDENEALRLGDFKKSKFASHRAAVRRLHAVTIDAAGTKIHLAGEHPEALGFPSKLYLIGVSPGPPQLFA